MHPDKCIGRRAAKTWGRITTTRIGKYPKRQGYKAIRQAVKRAIKGDR